MTPNQPFQIESTRTLSPCLHGPRCKPSEHLALRNTNSPAELDVGPVPELVYILVSLVLATEPRDS